LVILSASAVAGAQEAAPATSTRSSDVDKLDELARKQKALEDVVREQRVEIGRLQRAAGLPSDSAPAVQGPQLTLAVPTKATGGDDPELYAPLAGYSGKSFFLRDRHSWFVLIPKGRINIDWYNFLNRPAPPAGVIPNSAADPRAALRDTVFIRRARLGMAGTFVKVIDFRIEAELATVPSSGQYSTAAIAEADINIVPWLQLQAGQFYPPFTLENMTTENYTDFMEKAGPVRFAVPQTRDTGAMLHGVLPHHVGRYYLGVFNGEGQGFKNLDNQPAVLGRGFFAPLSLVPGHAEWMEEVWLGASFWWQRSDNIGGASAPSTTGATAGDVGGLSTQSGFSIFSGNYGNGSDANKNAIRSHLTPDGTTLKYDLEANVPLTDRYGLRGEFLHESVQIRRYDDTTAGRVAGPRGFLNSYGGYVEAYAWIGGPLEVDHPGLYQVPHWKGYVPPPLPRWAVQLALRYEHSELAIIDLAPTATAKAAYDPAQGRYQLDTLLAGASFWVTRNARLMANYGLNYVGGGEARAASALVEKNLFFHKYEHELLFRLQINF
jgi:hypothetical protein